MAYHDSEFILAVESIYPGQIKNRVDFTGVNHGDGPIIGEWFREDLREPTQEEIEAVDTDALLAEQKPQVDPETEVLYGHENRIRALEGQPPLTIGDFLTKMKR